MANLSGLQLKNTAGSTKSVNSLLDDHADAILLLNNSYKSYVAKLTQVGTGEPSAVELKNEIGAITYGRNSAGNYAILSDGLFTVGKTVVFLPSNKDDFSGDVEFFGSAITDAYSINLFTAKGSPAVAEDDILDGVNHFIEIRVYP